MAVPCSEIQNDTKLSTVRTIREQITGRLRADILSGKIPRGTKLKEQQLAERFGVSRAPIRDVLMELTQQGLAVSEPNCGARVCDNVAEWLQPLILEIRLDIEIFALKRSIKRVQEADISKLESIVELMSVACNKDDMATVAELDISFHQTLLAFAEEPDLVAIWLPIVTRMIMRYTRIRERTEIIQEHMDIVNAVRAKDLRRAVAALRHNVR